MFVAVLSLCVICGWGQVEGGEKIQKEKTTGDETPFLTPAQSKMPKLYCHTCSFLNLNKALF